MHACRRRARAEELSEGLRCCRTVGRWKTFWLTLALIVEVRHIGGASPGGGMRRVGDRMGT